MDSTDKVTDEEMSSMTIPSLHRSFSDSALDLLSKEAVSLNRNTLLIDQDSFDNFTKEMREMWTTFSTEQESKVSTLMDALNKYTDRKKTTIKPSEVIEKYEELKARIEKLERERKKDIKYFNKLESRLEHVEKLSFVTYIGMGRIRSTMRTTKHMGTDDSMSDDVFEDDSLRAPAQLPRSTPSPTGYRDYRPPADTPSRAKFEDDDMPIHKTILLGDSGVGKTSLLVQFETGKFQQGNFSATVGIGFTVMLLGDSGVGKTCMLVRFRDGTFLAGNYISTVGIDFRNKVVTVDGIKVKLQIWDTAGQERFRSVTHAYYRDAHALLLLYDVTNKISFDNIRAWLGEIREYAQDDVVIMLLGNKSDSGLERAVKREEGQRLAREYQVSFMETSAKTGLNVEAAFAHVARSLVAKANPVDPSRLAVRATQPAQEQRSTCPPCSS